MDTTTIRAAAARHGIDEEYCRSFLLRIGLTPNCNYRCTYCNPVGLTGSKDFLSDTDLVETIAVNAVLGVRRVHLTGGEPLMRRDLPALLRRVEDLTGIRLEYYLTTNGSLLTRTLAEDLAAVGMRRCNVSVDAFGHTTFRAVAGKDQLDHALRGARVAGEVFERTKLNMVVLRQLNLGDLPRAVDFCQENGLVLRLMELLPFSITPAPDDFFVENHVGKEEMESLVDAFGPRRRVDAEGNNWACDYWQVGDLAQPIGIVYHHSRGYGCVRERCLSVRLSSTGSIAACYTAGHGTRTVKELPLADKVEQIVATYVEKRELERGLAPYPRYHLPDYETFRGDPGAVGRTTLQLAPR